MKKTAVPPRRSTIKQRRASIAAEPFDPEAFENLDVDEGMVNREKTVTQCAHLKEVCRNIIIFKYMDSEHLDKIVSSMIERTVETGETIIKQGDDGDNFYVIESGKFEAHVRSAEGVQKKVMSYDNSGYFGELALMYNAPRSATIIAKSSGRLWYMDRIHFQKFVLFHAFKQRRTFLQLLNSVTILQKLSSYECMNLADALTKKTFEDGQCIIEEGKPGVEMYFVMEGKAVVRKLDSSTSEESTLNELGPGEYFGELALLSNQPRAASVYAIGRTTLAVLDVESFERLLGPCVGVMKRNTDQYASTAD